MYRSALTALLLLSAAPAFAATPTVCQTVAMAKKDVGPRGEVKVYSGENALAIVALYNSLPPESRTVADQVMSVQFRGEDAVALALFNKGCMVETNVIKLKDWQDLLHDVFVGI